MKKKIVILIISIIIAFLCGLLIGYYEILPISFLIDNIFANYSDDNVIPFQISESETASLIRINSNDDIIQKRNSLIGLIWNEKGFPFSQPTTIDTNINDSRYNDHNDIKQIDKIIINMDNNINSISYLFHPLNSNNKLLIYHQGHDGDFFNGKNTIQFFLKKGYTVLALSMPLLGMNNQPVIELPNSGKVKFSSHNQFILLDSNNFSSIKYFVEPIAISLNYLDKNYNFDSYYMVGISGGGWTTVLYAAIDDRISKSYSVAGSLPLHLRYEQKNIGDYEQLNPKLYSIANYLELYVMASYGEQRKFVQIFNKYDPCCFSGELYKTYKNVIKQKMEFLQNGVFEVYLDDTHSEHKISNHALNFISNDIEMI